MIDEVSMNDEVQTVDVAKIMQEVRDDIARKGYRIDMLEFSEISPSNSLALMGSHAVFDRVYLDEKIGLLASEKDLAWYRPVEGNALVRFVKKVMRKITSFYIAPIAEDASRFNADAADALSQLAAYIDLQDKRVEELQMRLERLEQEQG